MAKTKKAPRRKHIPQRTCVGCREVLPKRTMIRVVRGKDGVTIDPSGKMAGRGAYLHDRPSCWEIALRGKLAGALKTTLTVEETNRLATFASTLSE